LCPSYSLSLQFFLFQPTATPHIYPLSLHDALPISLAPLVREILSESGRTKLALMKAWMTLRATGLNGLRQRIRDRTRLNDGYDRSEEHTSELQSLAYLVCRLLLEKKNNAYSTQ